MPTARAQFQALNDDNSLALPPVGSYQLRILSSNVLELFMVTAKDPDPAPLTTWNFLDAKGNGTLPPTSAFSVSANGQNIPVSAVGFKRRVGYAPLRTRDLRVNNWLYLQLGGAVPAGAVVTVQNLGGNLWGSGVNYSATNSAQRFSPAIHVNQAGYVAGLLAGNDAPKKAMVGYYLGTLGEMPISSGAGFQLVNASSGATVFSGSLKQRRDVGYSYTPTPYQQVYEADFSSFNTPGEYKLVVPGLGASFPFFIDEGMAATYARTYALGIYHQRCGTDNVMPYTRHTHGPCHTNLVMIPAFPGPEQDFVNHILDQESAGADHPAPRMTSVAACLYPFVNTAPFDARGGHHDAGDYSKYTTSVSLFIHNLIFAVDSLPGVKDLDNLGVPESGDGLSDIMQEAKWEADYLAKLQDADGGFYFIVYPRARQYELDVTPDHGDLQLVLPKNTAATAAAVGALADMASSPTFKAAYPTVASNYLAKALKGWQFLQNAIARYGKDGAYQMVTFSGHTFWHNDELAWAAAALYNATGDPAYQTALRSYMPNPNSQSLRRWAWWSMFGGWGCATRDYGFAVRSGKLNASQIDPSYLALCEAEIKFAGSNAVDWSAKMAYGSSFTDESKGLRVAGWYFSGEWTLDPAAAWVVDSNATTRQLYLDCILKNYNYEMGCNPVNVTYLTGLGMKRQREIVHQYALNDYRVLPPTGIPLGNIQAQYDYLQLYKTELSSISYPLDDSPGQPYAYYDRWADTFNVSTEFVVSQTAKTLPAAAMLMAMGPAKTQTWNSSVPVVVNLPKSAPASQQATPTLLAPGISASDWAKARVVWEAREQEPAIGPSYSFTPKHAGSQWVEAEAQLPDGRRLFALTNYVAILEATSTIEQFQAIPLDQNSNVVAWYKFDGSLTDAKGHEPAMTLVGNAFIDNGSFSWANRPNGAALRIPDLNDGITVAIPNADLSSASSTALSIEAMFYVNRQVAYGRGNADLFVLSKNWSAEFAWRHNVWTDGPAISGGGTSLLNNTALAPYLKTGQWQHLKIRLDRTGYTVVIDGQTVANVPSGDLANWGGGGSANFKIGGFDGWVDEIVVKNEGGGTVVTNPPPPPTGNNAIVSISTTANASEGGLVNGSFQVTRNSAATTNLPVNLSYAGTATSGVDFSALPVSLTIPAGSTSVRITVSPIQDAQYEGNETIVATISANSAYSIGTQTATMTLLDDDPDNRPPPPGQTNYVTNPQSVTTNIVALYHLDGNLTDASGRFSNLTLGGAAALNSGNLSWMNSPSGSALRVLDLGDNATVTLSGANLYTSGVTESFGIEAYVFVNSFVAYSHKPATIFKLAKRWDAQMILNQDTWQKTPELLGGIAKMIDVPALAPYLQTNCWQKIGIFLDESGYFVKVNDTEVARAASTDISKWAGAGDIAVELGSFDGWIDEIAIRSNVKGAVTPTPTNQTITFNALPGKTYGNAPFTLNATASSGLPVNYSSDNTSVATISGNTVTIVGAGTAVITATQSGNANYNAATPVSRTLTVNKAIATVTLGNLSATSDGTAKQASVTTSPSGLSVNVTYNGGLILPLNAGSYAVVATVDDANYSGSASGTLVISLPTNLPQTITFNALPAKKFGDASFSLNATASSGLPVSYSSGNTSVATVSGNTVTIVGAGTAVITASQAGNATYNPATSVSQTLTVSKANATVTLSGLTAVYSGTAKSVSATTSPSGLPVTITYNGGATAPANAGSYSVAATINHNNYTGSATGTLMISPATQTITFGPLAAKTFGDSAFTLNATASSGLPVSYSSGNTSVATISGNTVTIVGAGTTVITASQPGNANYSAANSVSQTLTVNKANATVTLSGLTATFDGSAKTVSPTTSPSGLPVTITYDGSSVAPASVGSYAVVATVNSANYTGSASGTLTINKAKATVTLSGLTTTFDGSAKIVSAATSPSGLPVTITYDGSSVAPSGVGNYAVVATVNSANYTGSGSGTLTINKANATVTLSGLTTTFDGSAKIVSSATSPSGLPVTITYDGSGVAPSSVGSYAVVATVNSANYTGSASGTLTINKANAVVTLGNLSADYDGSSKPVSVSTTPAGLVVSVTYNGNASAPSAVGSYTVLATVNDVSYAGSASGTLLIVQPTNQPQTITFAPLPAKTFGDAAFALNATASSGLPVSFSSGNPGVATISGNTVTIVGAGTAVITANQTGNTIYNPATPVLRTLTVSKAAATVTLSGLTTTYNGSARSVSASTTPSGLPVSVSYNGSAAAPVNAGSYPVNATINHNNYTGSASGTLMIEKATALVTLGSLNATFDGSPKSVSVSTTPGGLNVNVTYNGTSTVPSAVGSYAIAATVNDANYTGTASGTLKIVQPTNQTQTITFDSLPAKTFGNPSFTLSASASSGLPVSFSSGNPSVAKVSGNTVTIVGAGTAVITATQNGDAIYDPATPVSQTLTVNKASATVSLSGLTTTYNGSAKTVSASTTPSGLPVSINYNDSATGPVNAGSYTVNVAITDANYTGSATGTLTINKANANVALSGLNAVHDGSAKPVNVTTTPAGLAVTVTYNGSSSAPSAVGNYAVNAIVTDANYIGSASGTLTITDAPSFVTLTVATEGQGTVSPNLNGASLLQGTNVTLTAKGASGWQFAGWLVNGSISSNNPVSITLQNSTMVTALFSDAIAPVVNITDVLTNYARDSIAGVTVMGTANDNEKVAAVEFALVNNGVVSEYQEVTGTTNWILDLPWLPYGTNYIRIRARDFQGNVSSIAERKLIYIVTQPLALTVVGPGTVTPNLSGQMLELGKTYTITATPKSGNAFKRWEGSVTSSERVLSFVMIEGTTLTAVFDESKPPLVAITSPATGARMTNNVALFKGAASDASGVARVEFAVNDEPFQTATGTTNWSATASLRPGTNYFRVRSVDRLGNVSATTMRPVFYAMMSPLTLWVIGNGKVTGATNGQFLEIGRTYHLNAAPRAGHLFGKWSGGVESSTPTLKFVMQPNLVLQARFVTNAFMALRGTYHGLFMENDAVRHERSGSVRLTVSANSTYSGVLRIGTRAFGFAGKFSANGDAQNIFAYANGVPITLKLHLDTTNLTEKLEGFVAGSSWESALSGFRKPTYTQRDPSPVRGRYTFVIPNLGNTEQPDGPGIGTMVVNLLGDVVMSGRLGDGTAFSYAGSVSRDGRLPFYLQLYAGNNGSVLSWLNFTNRVESDFNGSVSWIKPPSGVRTPYNSGFAVNTHCYGSAYSSAAAFLDFTDGELSVMGGVLDQGFANAVRLTPLGILSNLSGNRLVFYASRGDGVFSGAVLIPNTAKYLNFRGVVFQKSNIGFGQATGGFETSAVRLQRTEWSGAMR